MNTRREIVIALGAGTFVAPFIVFAQPVGKIARIGVLSQYPTDKDRQFEAFKQQLRDLGHMEGKTISINYLSAEADYSRLATLAADLVQRNVDVIMAIGGTPATIASRNATKSIPIVFTAVADPVGENIVSSLARPGGNLTGITNQNRDVAAKLLSLLTELVPSAKRIAILANPSNLSFPLVLSEIQAAAKTLRMEIVVINARATVEFDRAFTEIARTRADCLLIHSDVVLNTEAGRLAMLAAKYKLPTMGGNSLVPENGGLMSYGADRIAMIRRAAILVDKILRGAKPADIPVEQPTKFDLVLNMRTARDLGIKIPNSILVQATRVIE